jgi:hypothetical protein
MSASLLRRRCDALTCQLPNNAINSDAQKLRCAPLLRAGYGERYVPGNP